MRTEPQLFDEVGAALQFPDYFGDNWDAMDECITDLAWMPARGYLLIVTDGHQVLADDDEDAWTTLVRLMNDAAQEWSEPSGRGEPWARQATPFHIVFQAREDDLQRLLDRLAASGVEYSQVVLPEVE